MLPGPLPVIVAANPAASPPGYVWDSWDPYQPLGTTDDALMTRLEKVNDIAVVGFALACAEWVYGRLQPYFELDKSDEYNDYIEAFWIWLATSPRRIPPPESVEAEHRGMLNGMMDLALMTALNAQRSAVDHESATDAGLAALIARYVQADPVAFMGWLDWVVSRLERDFPHVEDEYERTVLVREVFEPSASISTGELGEAARRYLAGVNESKNRFLPLSSP
jgi:hypothetical protein